MKIKSKLLSLYIRFKNDERGEIGIKQIAMTLAVILVIGFAVSVLTQGNFIQDAVTWVWEKFKAILDKTFK